MDTSRQFWTPLDSFEHLLTLLRHSFQLVFLRENSRYYGFLSPFYTIVLLQGAVTELNRWGAMDGLFLVRLSTREHGYYVLSLALNKQIFHYQIRSRVRDRYIFCYFNWVHTQSQCSR